MPRSLARTRKRRSPAQKLALQKASAKRHQPPGSIDVDSEVANATVTPELELEAAKHELQQLRRKIAECTRELGNMDRKHTRLKKRNEERKRSLKALEKENKELRAEVMAMRRFLGAAGLSVVKLKRRHSAYLANISLVHRGRNSLARRYMRFAVVERRLTSIKPRRLESTKSELVDNILNK